MLYTIDQENVDRIARGQPANAAAYHQTAALFCVNDVIAAILNVRRPELGLIS